MILQMEGVRCGSLQLRTLSGAGMGEGFLTYIDKSLVGEVFFWVYVKLGGSPANDYHFAVALCPASYGCALAVRKRRWIVG